MPCVTIGVGQFVAGRCHLSTTTATKGNPVYTFLLTITTRQHVDHAYFIIAYFTQPRIRHHSVLHLQDNAKNSLSTCTHPFTPWLLRLQPLAFFYETTITTSKVKKVATRLADPRAFNKKFPSGSYDESCGSYDE
jgi:hypothetical protein